MLRLDQINRIADRQLTTEEIMILRLRTKLSPTEIAEGLGITAATVHNHIKRAKAKIKEQQIS